MKEQDKLDLVHGDYRKMIIVFEKEIQLYEEYLKKEGLTEFDLEAQLQV